MNKLINTIKTSYGHLSNRMIEEYDRRQYMRFYKGHYVDIEWPRAKVSLATACFYIGQGIGLIRGYTSVLRTGLLNRFK